ncbi:spliced partial mRNA, partial [Pan troglodytes]
LSQTPGGKLPFKVLMSRVSLCLPGWSAMAQSRLTAASTSWAQAILPPQPPEQLGLQSSNSLQYTYSFLGRSSGADWLQREGNCFTFIFLGHFQIRIAETYFNISSPKYALEVHFF